MSGEGPEGSGKPQAGNGVVDASDHVEQQSETGGLATETDKEEKRRQLEEKTFTLFALGQAPVMLTTWVVYWLVDHSFAKNDYTLFVNVSALASLVASNVAIFARHNHRNWAIGSLIVSLVLTVVYLHLLVGFTGGAESMFVSLYLYLPAVVLMVAGVLWAEVLSAATVFVSFLLNFHRAIFLRQHQGNERTTPSHGILQSGWRTRYHGLDYYATNL
jgi:hypothetical protein